MSLDPEMSLAHALPPAPAADDAPAVGSRQRRRWEFWRSPEGQPPWARPALLGIAAVAALLYARNLAGAGLAPFYSVAVKSMSVSWKAFFYGFQAKMLQAWIILPALGLGYLLAAPGGWAGGWGSSAWPGW